MMKVKKVPRIRQDGKEHKEETSFGGEGIKLIVIERNKVIFRSYLMMLIKEIILHLVSPPR
jgi:hypothetical protein